MNMDRYTQFAVEAVLQSILPMCFINGIGRLGMGFLAILHNLVCWCLGIIPTFYMTILIKTVIFATCFMYTLYTFRFEIHTV
jgi:hypothetical protein